MFMSVLISTYISVYYIYYIVFIFIVVHKMSIYDYDMYILCIYRYNNCGILLYIYIHMFL